MPAVLDRVESGGPHAVVGGEARDVGVDDPVLVEQLRRPSSPRRSILSKAEYAGFP